MQDDDEKIIYFNAFCKKKDVYNFSFDDII